MTPDAFIAKWSDSGLGERAGAQEHFRDLCALVGEPTPSEADPAGESYAFERAMTQTTGRAGFADVWKRGHFAWEYKGPGADLEAAYAQLQRYAVALENPPLLIVSDMRRIHVHTNWTNTIRTIHRLELADLRTPGRRELLKHAFAEPERLKPGITRRTLTEDAAQRFAGLALHLRNRGQEPHTVAHFVNRLVFCMFAEDVGLLPNKLFLRMLEHAEKRPAEFQAMAADLFRAMRTGSRVGFEQVDWFNGGLFDDDAALPLDAEAIRTALHAARLDWSEIDPSIFGTLFERGLDPDKRSQLGAHYTDREKIMLIVEPVVVQPLTREWEKTRLQIAAEVEKAKTARARLPQTQAEARRVHAAARRAEEAAWREARRLRDGFLDRLRTFRVLDPACGSGNFLYLALLALKDIEHRANLDAEALGLERVAPSIGPEAVKGLEINPYAAELARVTVWIGEIQWMKRNGFDVSRSPILRPLDTIECRDALLNADGTEAEWPAADAVVGNPPFLGDKMMVGGLGVTYVERLRGTFAGRVPGGADFVCYWFEKARALIEQGRAQRAGLVATQSIRRGANRVVLDRISDQGEIFDAWADEPWVLDGASVRVSLICFYVSGAESAVLNGTPVPKIQADLSSSDFSPSTIRRLLKNSGTCFQGPVKVGPFDIDGRAARDWVALPLNPSGHENSDVVRPWMNGIDLTRRPQDFWIIDFGEMPESEASLYEVPFEYARQHVKPIRDGNRRERRRRFWWQHGETVPGLRKALANLSRYIVTPRVAKHRVFIWAFPAVLPDSRLNAIARQDDTTFGIVHSRHHEIWSLKLGGWHGVGNDPQYTPSTGFETFPFPEGLTPDIPATAYADDPRARAVAAAAARLDELRGNWLNPPDLVRRVPEVVPGYPDRLLPVDDEAAAVLKARTLTNLYNRRPAWLANAHRDLDAAVAAAYGWPADLPDEEVLARLFALNQERAGR